MAVYPYTYKVLNRQTGRKVSVKKWRVQIRQNGENINKVFDEESLARSFEEDELKRLKMGIPQDKLIDLKYQMEMPSIASMLQKHFDDYLSKHSPNSLQTNKNRCESSIPAIRSTWQILGRNFLTIAMATTLSMPCSSEPTVRISSPLVTSSWIPWTFGSSWLHRISQEVRHQGQHHLEGTLYC